MAGQPEPAEADDGSLSWEAEEARSFAFEWGDLDNTPEEDQ